jgi:hypothetical protein
LLAAALAEERAQRHALPEEARTLVVGAMIRRLREHAHRSLIAAHVATSDGDNDHFTIHIEAMRRRQPPDRGRFERRERTNEPRRRS